MSDPDLIQAFALAVIRKGGKALLLTDDNQGDGWVPVSAAVRESRPFAVDLRDDVVAGDWDSSDGVLKARAFAEAAERSGYAAVVVASGRPGHAHVFVVVVDDEDRLILASTAKAMGADVRRTIRPPLAPHRLGLTP